MFAASPAPPLPSRAYRSRSRVAWAFAHASALALALVACSERVVIIEPLWAGDVVVANFGGRSGGGGGGADAGGGLGDALADGVADAGPVADTGVADGAGPDGGSDGEGGGDVAVADAGVDASVDAVKDAGADAVSDVVGPDTVGVDTQPQPDGGGDDAGPIVTFEQLWEEVYKPWGCASPACHGAATTVPIFVDVASSKAALVNKAAVGPCAPGVLVVPFAPASSVLLHKIDASKPGCGLRMPSADGVDADGIALVRTWIEQGAK